MPFDSVFLQRGAPRQTMLGVRRFAAGVRAVSTNGETSVLVPPARMGVAIASVIITALVVDAVILIASVEHAPYFAVGVTVLAGVLLVGMLVFVNRKLALVVDGRRKVLEVCSGRRIDTTIDAALVQRIWVRVFSSSSYGDYYDVFADLGNRELWIAQETTEADARRIALAVSHSLAVPLEPTTVRSG